jgi:predicted transposase/invertase (TIGR01784 family)
MQNRYQSYFKNRSIYYIARSISRQGEPGSSWNYDDVKAVYLIAFLNFKLSDISSEFRTDVGLMDMVHKTQFSDKLRLIFLQLPYFEKEVDDCVTTFEKIIYVLKNMDVLKRMPWLAQDAVFQKMASITDVSTLSKEERVTYDENLRKYRDTVAVMQGQWDLGHEKGINEGMKKGVAEGMKKGVAEGMKKGAAKKQFEVARNLKSMGLSDADIAKATGLSAEEIENL